MRELYVSTDVEADGPVPGPHSMLSLGSAVFDLGAEEPTRPVATFEANLQTLEGASGAPETMKFWRAHPEAWAAHRVEPRPARKVMPEYVAWLRGLPGRPVFVGYPVTFDFMWVYWYVMRFGGPGGTALASGTDCPFGFAGLDMKTAAWARLGGDFRAVAKRKMPQEWFEGAPAHDHTALTDAIGQGVLFVRMMLAGGEGG